MKQLHLKRDSKCIIIGNGPSVLNNKIGHYINTFEEVIRFNRFAIKGYEEFVGYKTTIWCTFGKGEFPTDNNIRPQKIIYTHGNKGNPSYEPNEIMRIPLPYFRQLKNRIQKETLLKDRINELIPSSGILVISWLLDNYLNNITISGFDHFSKEKSLLHHYWINKKFTKPKEHDGDWEKKLIDSYIANGKILKI